MLAVVIASMWVTLAAGVVLLLAGAVGRMPRPVTLAVLAVAEAATLVAVAADVSMLARGSEAITARFIADREGGERTAY